MKRKSTGKVDNSKTYTAGRYMIGPDFTFKKYQADLHFVQLDTFAVFTSGKLEVRLSAAFQFYLLPEDLGELHKEYDLFSYAGKGEVSLVLLPVGIERTKVSAIKGEAALPPLDEYIRVKVEKILFDKLVSRLEGTCCRAGCQQRGTCKSGCKPRDTCACADKGLFLEVRSFQLLSVFIPNDVKSRYLSQVIETANEERETFVQREKLVRKETEKLIKDIDNEAAVILQNTSVQASLAKSRATATAQLQVEAARNAGLTSVYQMLGITAEKHKASFNYLRSLRKRQDMSVNVDYTTLMARGD
ncbi:uncharacterized protein LOC116619573 [Nematostella vectensis]|uniref:uncharacterized protein LOC116619573 n=1 Tax=Nematostella vectensis TaxID=45351 RepID=UPI0020779171|nr:uncharacterized protein LOC116619573 [Nematostella vectensis]